MPARLRRTLLVGRDLTGARELLAGRARAGLDTTGWEPTTLRSLAAALAQGALEDEGRVEGDDVALVECSGAALDGAIGDGTLAPAQWSAHAARLGFRDTLHDAVQRLRIAGVPAGALREVAAHGTTTLLAEVLARYERELARQGIADPAHVFTVALREFDAEAPFVLGTPETTRVVLAAGLRPQGLPAALHARLLAWGAEREAPDDGTAAPLVLAPHAATWTIRRCASPDDEVRAVLRDALARGLPWDAIELAVSDADGYASAIRATCLALGVPCTIAPGLPLVRHRLGRAMTRWATLVAESLDARTLWSALLEGDIAVPDGHDGVGAARLAHDLRALSVGWGRERWDRARARLADGRWAEAVRRPRYDDAEPPAAHEVAARASAMGALLDTVLRHVPALPARGALADTTTTAASLARAALDWLALAARAGDETEEAPIRARIAARLARVAERDHVERPSRLALAVVEQAIADVRWWPTWRRDGTVVVGASRRAQPRALHVVELRDAGTTGRPHVALLGLDTDRTGGGTAPEPFLGEGLRERLNAALGREALPLAETRVRELRARLDWALLRCTGREVTLSWSAFEPGRDAELTVEARVLEAARLRFGDATLGHDSLRERLQEPVGPVPLDGEVPPLLLDARDAWLHAVHGGTAWRDVRAALHAGAPHLARAARLRAVHARDAVADAFAFEAMGHVPDFAAAGDPFAGRMVSASELEALGSCPSRWFYQYLLRTRPPEDAQYEPFAWLDAKRQGSVLHEVFEGIGRAVIAGRLDLEAAATDAAVVAQLDAALARVIEELPPPSDWILDVERTQLLGTLERWLAMERAERRLARAAGRAAPQWLDVETVLDGTRVAIGPHEVTVRGRVDRVDRMPDGSLRIVDYKTSRRGAVKYFGKEGEHFRQGRLVQPVLYQLALAAREEATVSRFEYRFPAATPPHLARVVDDTALAAGRDRLLPTLVAQLRLGAFLPTDDKGDCTWCDMRVTCRTRDGERDTESPRAAWAKARGKEGHALLVPLLRRREGAALDAGSAP